ncbi:MAG: hypothetical protein Faunusvirus5_28 [Faunusvirus sp.]|uniref:Uncharacterized protein n=1 Tax=Faunusvirus sp. TaxID=2487766 RepID=A0A3G5A143_9VIRU|nr:MAG: hypothetical protein Faunusvirus5_28 [Faunusvirus sp.]
MNKQNIFVRQQFTNVRQHFSKYYTQINNNLSVRFTSIYNMYIHSWP